MNNLLRLIYCCSLQKFLQYSIETYLTTLKPYPLPGVVGFAKHLDGYGIPRGAQFIIDTD
jgi:hypothetical protein